MVSLQAATAVVGAMLLLGAVSTEARSKNGFDLDNSIIPFRQILSGGPPRDGIPALNQPGFAVANDADFLERDDRVLGVVVNYQARAYPIKILNWHEIVNDRIDNQHFAVTYCPLCGTGMVFATNDGDSGALIFGVSGLLYNSDMLLFDRNTESLWSQIMAKAISGPLVNTPLPQLPAFHTTWEEWRTRHPATQVLSTDTGFDRNYNQSPYGGYERTRQLYFKVANRAPRDYHPKSLVMGIEADGTYKAYPFEELPSHGEGEFTDEINGRSVTIHWSPSAQSAHATDTAGKPMPTTTAYWFAWYAFHPETLVFNSPERKADL